MARPIKYTPELSGKDAVRFETLISNPRPVPNEEKECDKYSRCVLRKNGFQFCTEQDKDDETRLMFLDLKNFVN